MDPSMTDRERRELLCSLAWLDGTPRPMSVGRLRREQEADTPGKTQWDGDEGPFTWAEFVRCYGGAEEAEHWWRRAALERRMDGDEGPFTWAEFVRCYGGAEAAFWWRRSAWVAENTRPAAPSEGLAMLLRSLS